MDIKKELKRLDKEMKKALDIEDFAEFHRINKKLGQERYHILSQCNHQIDKIPNKKNKNESVRCIHCDESFWFCPKSPNHICKYDDKKDPAHDNCIYCGQPEERK